MWNMKLWRPDEHRLPQGKRVAMKIQDNALRTVLAEVWNGTHRQSSKEKRKKTEKKQKKKEKKILQ